MLQKPSAPPKKKKGKGCLIGCLVAAAIAIVLFILLIGGGIVYSLKDWRSDESVLANYQPTAEIADIAEQTALTDFGKATFYRANPMLVEGDAFRQECLANGIESLACNTGFKIFLLDIDDPKFADHKYSASVHEMLHIAYRRLSADEKQNLNKLLEQELAKNPDGPHLTGVIETLTSNGRANDVNEELHSKFGVEYAKLSPALEDYYSQYFTDRATVVSLFTAGGFNKRVRRMEVIAQETNALGAKLTVTNSQLTAYKSSGEVAKFNTLLSSYNSMVARYNAKATESQKLYAEIQEFYQYFNPDYQPPAQQN